MKTKIYMMVVFFALAALPGRSVAQSYVSMFGNTSTTWDVILFGACDAICSQTVVVAGDTTIGSKTYKVISGLPGFVREDTVQGKAWFYSTYYNAEYLVMDLNLNLGDYFDIYDYTNTAHPFIVDSVYYVGNLKHVRLDIETVMCAMHEKITFIEGSGTTAGFTYQRQGINSYMLCQHKDGVKTAGNILFSDSCYVCEVGVAEKNPDGNTTNIFPNPAIDELNIEVMNMPSCNTRLAIYNIIGEMIYSQNISGKRTTVNVSEFGKGVYFVVVGNGISNRYQMFIKK
jgi:hypothetical protein